tara:strand:- start:49 stop:423 length:375 start_codon:yes stop_codon:yes gene_type:complete
MYRKIVLIFMLLGFQAQAHEMTPAYPKFELSYIDGVSVTKMSLFNRRNDASYYEIGVFTKDWEEVPFASTQKVIKVRYTKRYPFEVYVRNGDLEKVVYICTISKILKGSEKTSQISSRICSKVK